MASLCDLVCLRNGLAAPLFVVELVHACERSGIRLSAIDGDITATCDRPDVIDDDLINDLRRLKSGVIAILLNTPGDWPDRHF